MRIGRRNRSTRRKPAPVPLYPPQIPHDLIWNRGRRGGKPATIRLSWPIMPYCYWRNVHTIIVLKFKILKSMSITFRKLLLFPSSGENTEEDEEMPFQ
jgi:hypothetical protein